MRDKTCLFLLLVDMANLEPNVFLSQGTRWVCDYVFEALGRD
jgi:hypothetical protein